MGLMVGPALCVILQRVGLFAQWIFVIFVNKSQMKYKIHPTLCTNIYPLVRLSVRLSVHTYVSHMIIVLQSQH